MAGPISRNMELDAHDKSEAEAEPKAAITGNGVATDDDVQQLNTRPLLTASSLAANEAIQQQGAVKGVENNKAADPNKSSPKDSSGNKPQGKKEEMEDDVSVASQDMRHAWNTQLSDWNRAWDATKQKKNARKFARASAIYVEALENRVGILEKELFEVQVVVGSRTKEENEKSDTIRLSNAPCSTPLPLKVIKVGLKEWRAKGVFNKKGDLSEEYSKSCIVIGFTARTTPDIGLRPLHNSKFPNRKPTSELGKGVSTPPQVSLFRTKAEDMARLAFRSPWPFVLIELLSGEYIHGSSVWIYPFKHFIVYEKQIKKFLELLKDMDVESLKVKDTFQILSRLVEDVTENLGPKRDDTNLSDPNVAALVQKRPGFEGHFQKLEQSLADAPENGVEEKEEDAGTTEMPELTSHLDQVGQPKLPQAVGEDAEGQQSVSAARVPASEAGSLHMCTCLRDARDHIQLLVNVMDEYLSDLTNLREEISRKALKKIRFQNLWHLYQVGDLVVTSKSPRLAYRILHVSGGRPLMTTQILNDTTEQDKHRNYEVSPFSIDCFRYDFDGEVFGPVQETIKILDYDGERDITDLELYPIDFADEKDTLRRDLIERGQRFAQYRDFKHKRYVGLSLGDPQEEIESEVIIDFTQAFRQPDYSRYKPHIGLQGASTADVRESYEDLCANNDCAETGHSSILRDTRFDKLQMEKFVNSHRGMLLETQASTMTSLTEDQLILLPNRLHGFSLRSRNWVSLDIDVVQDILDEDSLEGQKAGFEDLVIREEYKTIVKAMVLSHALGPKAANDATRKQQVDLVRGKGKGLIILLHGVPGVGKTSTAESVAAYTRRPLFPITCGDIGQTAQAVEANLESIFLLARKWGCVLLLDEADVFLAERSAGGDNVDRNALVSVFLRTLEYYSGILFLTTNRIGSFDEAFISRIHMSLYYADLDEESTFKVWLMNLDRLKRSGRSIYIDNEHIQHFAREHWRDGNRWNGRQIRNAFQTAMALAEYDFHAECKKCEDRGVQPPSKPALEARHFTAVARTSAEFNDYIKDVMGGQSHKDKAQRREIRSDEWKDRGKETAAGKKYDAARAIRSVASPPDRKVSKSPTPNPPALPAPAEGGKSMSMEDKYKLWKADEERKKMEEEIRLFERMREQEESG